jgi:CubicO group peptidase (beta-lactamase class C family)
MASIFPDEQWDRVQPEDVGMSGDGLEDARRWLEQEAGEQPYRAVVVRGGRIVAEWRQGVEEDDRLPMASAGKSLFSSVLGIAVGEGRIAGADDRVVDYYPEMMDVPDGLGPKPGRFAKPEDRDITFRQLISNTSGYMKPGETPGSTFHYQTFGMNIVCHAIAAAYGLYDSAEPERLPGFGGLLEEKLRDPIGASWTHTYMNFKHPPESLIGIFGNYTQVSAGARDMARMGLLWLHFGRWGDRQVVPEDWLREASQTAPDVRRNGPEEEWCYGYAFWTNDHGVLWPALPRDSFAASGAGKKHVWVCPSLDLVVAQSPGIYEARIESDSGLLAQVVAACR